MMQPNNNSELNLLSEKPKKKVKRVVKRKSVKVIAQEPPKIDGVVYEKEADFETLNELSTIIRDTNSRDKICLSKKEIKCLEEIMGLASKIQAPLEDRLMRFYKHDVCKFATQIKLPEETVNDCELTQATAVTKEIPAEIAVTTNLNKYLRDLRNLVAKREMAWASALDSDYHHKGEIARLKNEVNHLRVVCSKRQGTIAEKEKIIAEREKKISSLEKFVNELKTEILHLAKNDGYGCSGKTVETELPDVKTILKLPGTQLRRNFGPAALLANSLNKARRAAL